MAEKWEEMLKEVGESSSRVSGKEVVRRESLSGPVMADELPANFRSLTSREILTSALTQGLKEGDFFRSLAKRPVRDFDDILSRAEKYVNLEEAQKGKMEELRDKRKERVEVHRDVAPKQFREQERRIGPVPRLSEPRLYTPLMASRSRVLMAIAGNKDLKWPVNYSVVPSRPKSKFFYEFHNCFGHTTEECRHLKDEIERMVKNGWLAGWVKMDQGQASNTGANRNHHPQLRGAGEMMEVARRTTLRGEL
ncbi:hypothetical protein DH2020_042468 [Rehmannia glutinosa]|uniref:Uncharacterized protein n=1 Tax=Rehmannia glutinosa TaxID=99300 RepID=A0ABR0UN72_REHGL